MKRTSCVTKTNVFVTSESNRFSLCIKLPRALVFSEIVHSWKHKGLESRKEGRSLDAPVRDRWLLGGVSLLTVLTTRLVLRSVYRHVRGSSPRGSSLRGSSLLLASSLLGSSRPRISSLALSKSPCLLPALSPAPSPAAWLLAPPVGLLPPFSAVPLLPLVVPLLPLLTVAQASG